jgi:di- and tripeptidase
MQIYDLNSFKRTRCIQAHKGSVLALSLSEDEEILVSAAADEFIKVASKRLSCGRN